ncbi:hypothetical protein L1987_48398 [Smallanthus sonchifolius]|uniref:Uncharacterized protein n=1 Tax=Smallanthus sonchifolius TaxID=185202 RepID=A0ACB9FR78_9ASTR|nr:hypothetical protein L1987_48398 [Smallanthus sonchifolius]
MSTAYSHSAYREKEDVAFRETHRLRIRMGRQRYKTLRLRSCIRHARMGHMKIIRSLNQIERVNTRMKIGQWRSVAKSRLVDLEKSFMLLKGLQ